MQEFGIRLQSHLVEAQILDNVTISNAKSCMIVDGSMVAKSLSY